MEVSKIGRAGLEKIKGKQDVPGESISFSELMQKKRNEATMEKFHKLIQDIDDQGKVLAETCTVEELRKYKGLVKELLDDTVKNGVALEERQGFNRRGRTKIYKIITEVDKKLLELTDAVLKKEEKGLRILDLVGEIKGMLVNIYA
ncbi:YaaR family protein [Ammoniphilus resinae]|uniref:Uncharacterized protein YaaR (DUF327 family) n=1 Tax=Ammoniphilus resinae TaxID=861532 RepID=A0ABS4GMI9_9BACL|nr:YaaR family protein [Ammoniphilus resinae]MBP1931485.1 uncharacterized protein YaaR (DUF327 family) [Ammoniphilus resinae]